MFNFLTRGYIPLSEGSQKFMETEVMRKIGVIFVLISFIFLLPVVGLADNGLSSSSNFEGAFAPVGVGVRGLGMGGAFLALADDASSTYWNPAGLGFLTKKEITFMYADLYGLITNGHAAYAMPDGGSGASGLAWLVTGSSELTDVNGKEMSWLENSITYSYARRLNDYISAGMTGKFLLVNSDFTNGNATGFGFDAGLSVWPDMRFGAGIMLRDIFTQVNWDTEQKDRLPFKYAAGLAFVPVNYIRTEIDVAGSEEEVIKRATGGLEVGLPMQGLEDVFMARMGLSRVLDEEKRFIYSAGMGIAIDRIRLDYAFMLDSKSELGNAHRISLTIVLP